jgi:Uncharacterized conserved protein
MSKQGSGEQHRPLVRIFISSPGDVTEERAMARALIDAELPKDPAFCERLQLRSIAWDDPAAQIALEATKSPQDSVNDALPRPAACDIVIVILGAHMGTPLPDDMRKPDGEPYLSGTEWEYEDAVNSPLESKPRVYVYWRTEKPKLDIDDPAFGVKQAQYQQVTAFCERIRAAGGVNGYAAPADFKALLEQHLRRLLHQFLPAPDGPTLPEPSAATIPPAYVEWLRREYADVSLLGQERQQGQALTLSHVYVPAITKMLRLQLNKFNKSTAEETYVISDTNLEYSAESSAKLAPLLAVLGEWSLYVPAPAGAGKSTFCRWAVLQSIAAAELTHPVLAPDEFAETAPAKLCGRLPLLVPLREFSPKMKCGRGEQMWCRAELEYALGAWVDRALADRLTGENLLAHLSAGTAFLLLDGLDEVPISDTRDGATVFPRDLLLSGLADALPTWLKAGNRVLLTSRPYGLDEEGLRKLDLPQAQLEPLPQPLQNLFIARWFHTLGKPEQEATGLIAAIRARDDLGPLAENPMMLTALCVLWDSGGRLPEDRYELYRRIVNNVLFHRFRDAVRECEPVLARLEAVAHGMHVGDRDDPRDGPAAEISHHEIDRALQAFGDDDPYKERGAVGPVAQREELLTRSGLLLPRAGDRAAFYHLSVQEFLAAERILRTEDDLFPVFHVRSAVAQWRPTLMFLFAGKIAGKTPRWGTDLLARLIAEQDRAAVKANPAPAVFIAEALDLCLAKSYAVPEALKESFRRLALNAIEDEVELQARQALGLTLGRVGDPRIFDLRDEHGNVDLRAYVEVPAGIYPFGDKGQTVQIAGSFWIGRYPVTNQQYAAFLVGGGYAERQWWTEAGWAWLEKAKVTEPGLWHDRWWNAPNQPVVGVSFWEAEAFCTWAGGRLPTEEEWEAAARGPKGLEYPWGHEWRDGICNSRESGLGVTSPVGLFPRSRQADRTIDDMTGNVWEWCDSFYRPAERRAQAPRVLRGGSWDFAQDYARSATRFRFNPYDRYDNVGFRVVCLSPSSGH